MYINPHALLSLIAGILILIRPALLNYIVAIFSLSSASCPGHGQMISRNVKKDNDIPDFHQKTTAYPFPRQRPVQK